MCTTRVYHSGGQNPLNIKEFSDFNELVCPWCPGKDTRSSKHILHFHKGAGNTRPFEAKGKLSEAPAPA